MSRIHTNKVGYQSWDQYDSISFGEKIFVEELSNRSIPADYEHVEIPKEEKNKKLKSPDAQTNSLDGLLSFLVKVFSAASIVFILYSLFGGILDRSEIVMSPFGREVGIVLGFFIIISISTILVLMSKTKIRISIKNEMLHIKSYKGLNHKIPLENIADCKINIFGKSDTISSLKNYKQYKIDLDAGLLVILKSGENLLIASSNTYKTNRNLVFN